MFLATPLADIPHILHSKDGLDERDPHFFPLAVVVMDAKV